MQQPERTSWTREGAELSENDLASVTRSKSNAKVSDKLAGATTGYSGLGSGNYAVHPLFNDEQSVQSGTEDVLALDGEFSGVSLHSSDVTDQPVEEALCLFDQLSSQLTSSYRNLEQKVSQLKNDLSEEALSRREQFEEKEALARRMAALLEIMPAGVVLLDGQGRVAECNPAALDLLGEPLEGELWLDIIKRCFAPKHDDGHEVSLKDGRRVRIETRSMTAEPGQLILLSDLTETASVAGESQSCRTSEFPGKNGRESGAPDQNSSFDGHVVCRASQPGTHQGRHTP